VGQDKHIIQLNNETIQQNKKIVNILRPGLCGDNPFGTVRFPQRSLFSQSLGKYWQLNQNNQNTEHSDI